MEARLYSPYNLYHVFMNFRSHDQTPTHGRYGEELCRTDSGDIIGFQHSANHEDCSSSAVDHQA